MIVDARYATRDEVAHCLRNYATHFQLPVKRHREIAARPAHPSRRRVLDDDFHLEVASAKFQEGPELLSSTGIELLGRPETRPRRWQMRLAQT